MCPILSCQIRRFSSFCTYLDTVGFTCRLLCYSLVSVFGIARVLGLTLFLRTVSQDPFQSFHDPQQASHTTPPRPTPNPK